MLYLNIYVSRGHCNLGSFLSLIDFCTRVRNNLYVNMFIGRFKILISSFIVNFSYNLGTYLSSPKTEKSSEDGDNERVKYSLSSMQAWRATMEDDVSQ
jgi:hypothetical protein